MSNPWFRMYQEFAVDPKIQMLSEANQRRYVMLLCLKCCNGNVTLHDEEVAFQLRISNEEWDATKAIFIAKDLITEDNKPAAWDKRQYASDSSRERVKRFRERQKQQCNVTVTPPDTDTDTDTDNKDTSKVASVVSIPKPKIKPEVQEIFLHWQQVLNHPRSILDPSRTKSIINALKIGFKVDDLKSAINGVKNDDWSERKKFDDFKHIFKDSGTIEKFISLTSNCSTTQSTRFANEL